LANIQLLNLEEGVEQKSCDLAKHVEEVDIEYLELTVESAKAGEELCQSRTSDEGFRKLCETLETQLSTFEDAREKLTVDLVSLRTRCDWYHQGYHYWKAKTMRYLAKLSFVPWL
jgi:AICAR transformylase/IMP cyclohydrolase PurH